MTISTGAFQALDQVSVKLSARVSLSSGSEFIRKSKIKIFHLLAAKRKNLFR
jgi:hypothetical protein